MVLVIAIEMAIVLFIVALLILIVVPNLSHQKKHAQTVHTSAMTAVVQTQLDTYLDATDKKTATLGELKREGYLTDKQVTMAQKEGIAISGDQVKGS